MACSLALIFGVIISVIVSSSVSTNSIKQKIDDTFGKTAPATNTFGVEPYPPRFSVGRTAITPVKDQGQRGTCWVFSTLAFLEASYRKNGFAKNFLAENEYVSFSEQAYGLGVIDHCMQHKTDSECYGGGPVSNTTEDGEPEWLYYFKDDDLVTKNLLPETVCPYKPSNDDQFDCPNREEAKKTNPISFTVKSLETAYSIDGIKALLNKHKMPLTWSHIVVDQTFLIPCTDSSVFSDSQMCQTCAVPCDAGCCALYILPSYDWDGTFALHGNPYVSGGHAMLLVGYNDEFRIDNGLPGDFQASSMGGFIIKNSWSYTRGHSVHYWKQDISAMEENTLCPNVRSSKTWIPADIACMEKKADAKACSSSYKRVKDQWVSGATVLKCSGKNETYNFFGFGGCNPDMRYTLAAIPKMAGVPDGNQPSGVFTITPKYSTGYYRFHLLEWDPSVPDAPAHLVFTNDTTWYGLGKVFTPVDIIENDPEQCGYFFLPYQTFLESNYRNPVSGHDCPAISYMDIEWDDSSYAKKPAAGKNYDQLKASTKTVNLVSFTGPLDFKGK